jgi:hypothetical protein
VIRSSGADPKLAAELIALNVEVMLAAATPAAKATQSATTKIAIVMADPGDAVQLGLVASLPLAMTFANYAGIKPPRQKSASCCRYSRFFVAIVDAAK